MSTRELSRRPETMAGLSVELQVNNSVDMPPSDQANHSLSLKIDMQYLMASMAWGACI
jgi:hypothetical protein